jgi:hypothetical protein
VHVSAGEVKLVIVLMHSNQLMWAGLDLGLSPVQPNNGGPGPAQQKKIFTLFCLNVGLYFMS